MVNRSHFYTHLDAIKNKRKSRLCLVFATKSTLIRTNLHQTQLMLFVRSIQFINYHYITIAYNGHNEEGMKLNDLTSLTKTMKAQVVYTSFFYLVLDKEARSS